MQLVMQAFGGGLAGPPSRDPAPPGSEYTPLTRSPPLQRPGAKQPPPDPTPPSSAPPPPSFPPPKDCCAGWTGVVCTSASVTQIDVSNLGIVTLNSTLPTEVRPARSCECTIRLNVLVCKPACSHKLLRGAWASKGLFA